MAYMLLLSEFQRARTLVPTEPMTAIAATTIRPATRAYSRTSPPCSSFTSRTRSVFKAFIRSPLRGLPSAVPPQDATALAGRAQTQPTALLIGWGRQRLNYPKRIDRTVLQVALYRS